MAKFIKCVKNNNEFTHYHFNVAGDNVLILIKPDEYVDYSVDNIENFAKFISEITIDNSKDFINKFDEIFTYYRKYYKKNE